MPRIRLISLNVLLMSAVALGQAGAPAYEPPPPSWKPHPAIFGGISLVGNGYQFAAENGGVAVLLNSPWIIADCEAWYMNARKIDPPGNRDGHERFLEGRLFLRAPHNYYFGGGAQWSETATTDYTKVGWRPTFGMGKDLLTTFDGSYRFQALYITKGTDRWNGLQGVEFQMWVPSPAYWGHFFYRMRLGSYRFHTTITDPLDVELTRQQSRDHHQAAFVDFSVGWRF